MTREEAAKICQSIKFILDNDDYSEEVEEALDMAIEALQQEPKRGEWLDAREEDPCWYICSECKRMVDDDSNYCPDCGAKMGRDTE